MTTLSVGLLVDPKTLKAQHLFNYLEQSTPALSLASFMLITPAGECSKDIPLSLCAHRILLTSNNLSHLSDLENLDHFDVIISFGWPHIISKSAIKALPTIVNIHGGALPEYKGGSVYLHMWAHKEKKGAATAHIMTEDVDGGNILHAEEFNISFFDSPKLILQKSSFSSIKVLEELLRRNLINNTGKPQIGGRYFYSASKTRLVVYRVVNELLFFIKHRALLPHRDLS